MKQKEYMNNFDFEIASQGLRNLESTTGIHGEIVSNEKPSSVNSVNGAKIILSGKWFNRDIAFLCQVKKRNTSSKSCRY